MSDQNNPKLAAPKFLWIGTDWLGIDQIQYIKRERGAVIATVNLDKMRKDLREKLPEQPPWEVESIIGSVLRSVHIYDPHGFVEVVFSDSEINKPSKDD